MELPDMSMGQLIIFCLIAMLVTAGVVGGLIIFVKILIVGVGLFS